MHIGINPQVPDSSPGRGVQSRYRARCRLFLYPEHAGERIAYNPLSQMDMRYILPLAPSRKSLPC